MSRISSHVAQVDDIQVKRQPITSWGIEVEIRGMTLEDRSNYVTALVAARESEDQDALSQLDAEIVVACTYDPEDNTLAFTEADIPMLMQKSAAVVATLSLIAQRLSGLDGLAEERLGKDFSTSAGMVGPAAASTLNGDSSSALPANLESVPVS